MAHPGGNNQRQDRGGQPVTGLGIMGDAVQRLVHRRADMIIDKMRQPTVDGQRQKPDQDGNKARPQKHGCWVPFRRESVNG